MKPNTLSDQDAKLILNRATRLQQATPGLSLVTATAMAQNEHAQEGAKFIMNRAVEIRAANPGLSLATAIGMARRETAPA
ncbi:MAG: hypothetical protein JWQ04_3186 [Pedosphaera sp.]|nr:hypothetical protein [Pedosphaera sp.]